MSSVLKKARLNVANGSPMSSPVETVKLLPATAKGDATSLGEAARGEGDTDTKDAVLTASLAKLRELLRQHGVSAYLIETQDAHQSEYVSDHDKRRAWLTGFNGSAGTALVTMTKALLWTDGRYFLQAGQQLESYWTLMRIGEHGVPNLEEWVAQEAAATRDVSMSRASLEKPGTGNNFDAGGLRSDRGSGTFKLGVDPWLLSAGTARSLSAKLAEAGGSLVTITGNLVDQIWTDQPPVSCQPVHVHPLEYAGVDVPEKLAMVRELLLEARASSMVVMALDEVAWLFNVRGSDVSFNPVPLSAALLTQDSAYLFMDSHKLGDGVMEIAKLGLRGASSKLTAAYVQKAPQSAITNNPTWLILRTALIQFLQYYASQ